MKEDSQRQVETKQRVVSKGFFGFTLIELLIVIAIILILIAIALPNFLEAQIRAKVVAAEGDMRSTATALEAYQTDWRKYPWPAEFPALSVPPVPPTDPFELHLSSILTSPVAYMGTLPVDPFDNLFASGSDQTLPVPFHYTEQETNDRLGAPLLMDDLTVAVFSQRRTALYFILSHGPDSDHDEDITNLAQYSPTNGTKSNGDIYYFGPGIGFN